MKIISKKSIKYLIIIFVLAFEAYLIFGLASGKINNDKETQQYCGANCSYNPDALLWDFSGEGADRGFTTKEGCFDYCSKAKNGFAFYYLNKFSASLLNVFNVSR